MELSELYAYLVKKDEEKINISDKIKFLLDKKEDVYSILQLEEDEEIEGAKLFTNVFNIESYDNRIAEIEAPNAIGIYCGENSSLQKVIAPNCKRLQVESNNILLEENLQVSDNCKIIRGDEFNSITASNGKIEYLKELWRKEDSEVTFPQEVELEGRLILTDNRISTLICNDKNIEEIYAPYVSEIQCNNNPNLKIINAENAIEIECNNCEKLEEIRAKSLKKLDAHNVDISQVRINNDLSKIRLNEKEINSEYYAYVEHKGVRKMLEVSHRGKIYISDDANMEGVLYTNAKIVKCNNNNLSGIIAEDALEIECNNNKIKELQAPNCQIVYCKNNLLKEIEFPNCKELYCQDNLLEKITAEKVSEIECDNNLVSHIYTPECRSITCENNPFLKRVEAPNCEYMRCQNTPLLKKENRLLKKNALVELGDEKNDLTYNFLIKKIKSGKEKIDISNSNKKEISEKQTNKLSFEKSYTYDETFEKTFQGFSKDTKFEEWKNKDYYAYVEHNGIRTMLEVSKEGELFYANGAIGEGILYTNAKSIHCPNGDLTGIVAGNAKYINCNNNKVAEIYAPECNFLHCKNNLLKEIDAPNCQELYCQDNQLEKIVAEKANTIDCGNNLISQIYAPECEYIYAENNPLLMRENINAKEKAFIELDDQQTTQSNLLKK